MKLALAYTLFLGFLVTACSGDPPNSDVLASRYDQACAVDADCVTILEVHGSENDGKRECWPHVYGAVNAAEGARARRDREDALARCDTVFSRRPPPNAPKALCVSNKCDIEAWAKNPFPFDR